jgi:hypothetical protein
LNAPLWIFSLVYGLVIASVGAYLVIAPRLQTHAEEMLALSAAIFDNIHQKWEHTVGRTRLRELEDALSQIAAGEPMRLDLPGWLS